MSKRRSVNGQMRKEEYEALENEDAGGLQEGFQTASADVLKKRRIIRVSNRRQFSKGKGPVLRAPSSAASATPLKSSTPATKSNPFASVSFASAASATKPKALPTFSFGASNPVTTKITPSRSTPSNAPPPAPAFQSPNVVMPSPKAQVEQSPKVLVGQGSIQNKGVSELSETDKLNLAMLRFGQMEGRANPLSDYSCWLKNYVSKMETILANNDKENSNPTSTNTTTKTNASKPFSFALSSSSPAPVVSKPQSTSASAPKPTFAFGKPAPAAPAPAPSPAPVNTTTIFNTSQGNNTTTTTNENAKTEVQHKTNEHEDELYTVRAKYRKLMDGKWKSYAAGVLRLYRHKTNGKCRVDLRNDIGKVQLSLALPKGMGLVKVPGKGSGSVLFHSIQNEAEGMKQFGLVVKYDHLDKLFEIMEEMTKE